MNKARLSVYLLVTAILVTLIAFTFISCTKPADKTEVTVKAETPPQPTETFALPTMLELGSDGCIPCEMMKPVMEELKKEHGELINIEFHDVMRNQAIARKYRVVLVPTQVFLRKDGTEFFRHEGFFAKEEIEKVFRDMGVSL